MEKKNKIKITPFGKGPAVLRCDSRSEFLFLIFYFMFLIMLCLFTIVRGRSARGGDTIRCDRRNGIQLVAKT